MIDFKSYWKPDPVEAFQWWVNTYLIEPGKFPCQSMHYTHLTLAEIWSAVRVFELMGYPVMIQELKLFHYVISIDPEDTPVRDQHPARTHYDLVVSQLSLQQAANNIKHNDFVEPSTELPVSQLDISVCEAANDLHHTVLIAEY